MLEMEVGGKEARENLLRAFGDLLEYNNPAQDQIAAQRVRPPRISMSQLRQRLQVPDIPGYRMYWFREENIPRAQDAYYEFVKRDEISTNPIGIGATSWESGNTDLGSNVSIVAGQGDGGHPVRLVLMKLKLEYYEEDRKLIELRNSSVMQAIFGEEAMTFNKDGGMRAVGPLEYRKKALFQRPRRKAGPEEARTLKARLKALEKAVEEKFKY